MKQLFYGLFVTTRRTFSEKKTRMPFSARRDSDAVPNFVSSSSISPNSGLEIKEPNRGKQLQLITNFGFADLLEKVSQKMLHYSHAEPIRIWLHILRNEFHQD